MDSQGDQKAVLFVCLGNICRSPIAACVFRHLIKESNQSNKWIVDSCGTGDWHVGHPADSRARDVLQKHNVDSTHSARQIIYEDFQKFNYIFVKDESNEANVKRLQQKAVQKGFKNNAKIVYLGDYDPEGVKIIPDPYYSNSKDAFDVCYAHCYRSCENFLKLANEGKI